MKSNLLSDINEAMRDDRLKYRKKKNAYLSLLWMAFIPITLLLIHIDLLGIEDNLSVVLVYSAIMLMTSFSCETAIKQHLRRMKVSDETLAKLADIKFENTSVLEILQHELKKDGSLGILRVEIILQVEAKTRTLRLIENTLLENPCARALLSKARTGQ